VEHIQSQPPSSSPTQTPPRRILVVDDDSAMRALCAFVLRAEGYEVAEAADGQEALAQAVSDPPDLVILDISMPVLDGFGLAAALRRDERTRELPLVFISGEAHPDVEGHAYDAGALGFFAKPFEPSVLSAFVRRVLEPFRPTTTRQVAT
jgi:PleD family two-component response regulator